MNSPRIISFDLDGTITDAAFVDSVWLEGIPRVYALKNGVSFEDAKTGVKLQYDKVGRERLDWYDLRYWIKKFELDVSPKEILSRYVDSIRIFPEVLATLKKIQEKGLRQIIVSNARREFVDLEIERTDIGRYFESVFSSTSDFGLVKKSVKVFRRVCSICDSLPEEMVHVGDDRVFDYQVPRKLGICAFYLDRTGQCKGETVIHSLKELSERLASLC
jgi:HAD superfamily hydrolase (TIGR01549 family)